MSQSARFQLDTVDVKKIGKGLLIAVAGSVIATISQELVPYLEKFGMPILIPVFSTMTNAALKWLKG